MRIKKVTLHGVGPFEHQTIEFRHKGDKPDLADVTLLVGENGTGKSTILYAIADQIDSKKRPSGNPSLLALRRHDAKSSVTPEFDDDRYIYGRITREILFDAAPNSAPQPESWAAFAYAGMRQVDGVRIKGIEELDWEPLSGALAFTSTTNGQRFAQWLALTNYRHRQATVSQPTIAERFESAIRRVESALSEILGEPVSFDFPIGSDITPRVSLRERSLSFDVLPDGLKSVLSWVGDLLMRHDRIEWEGNLPVDQREFLLLLDEIDVHLHPAWQRRVLPLAQKLFPKAQIIATTHSPLVVASADDADVVVLRRSQKGQPTVQKLDSQIGSSYSAVLRSVFGIESEFDKDTQEHLDKLHELKRELLARTREDRTEFDQLAQTLAGRSEELGQIVAYEKRQLDRQLKDTH